MKQTAVEWLELKIKLSLGEEFKYLAGFFEIAKEMEKQQIIDAFIAGVDKESINGKNFEQYYNELYGK